MLTLLTSANSSEGSGNPPKSPQTPRIDTFSLFLCFSPSANPCTPITYILSAIFQSRRITPTNPYPALQNAPYPSPATLRVQRQAIQTPCFLPPPSSTPLELG
jgi:hypothetical protein